MDSERLFFQLTSPLNSDRLGAWWVPCDLVRHVVQPAVEDVTPLRLVLDRAADFQGGAHHRGLGSRRHCRSTNASARAPDSRRAHHLNGEVRRIERISLVR